MISRPTDKEKVDRYVGQVSRIKKQLQRLNESMITSLDGVVDLEEERRLKGMLNRVMRAMGALMEIS